MRRRFHRMAWIVVCLLLLAAGLGLWGCGGEVASVGATTQPTSTGPAATSITTASGAGTTLTAVSETNPTIDDYSPSTTSEVFAAASRKGTEAALHLGDAVISYLSDKRDLAAVQSLVAPSAQEGLAQMLSLLTQPTGCKVTGAGGSAPYTEVQVGLLFAGGKSQQSDFTLTTAVDADKTTITAINATASPPPPAPPTVATTGEGTTTGSSPPVIQIQALPRLDYLSPDYAYYTAEAVVLATVVDVLPLRRNPLAGTADPAGSTEHQPMVYKGYILQVKKAYGPGSIPERITVYALGNGTVALDGVTYKVWEKYPLDASPGDTFFVPLMKVAYFGTPELKQDEYWVQANWAVFAVDDKGGCTRVTGADVDPEVGSEYPLSFLENIAVEQGEKPSVVH